MPTNYLESPTKLAGCLQSIWNHQQNWRDAYKLFGITNKIGGMPTKYLELSTKLVGCLQSIWNFQQNWWDSYKIFGINNKMGEIQTKYLQSTTISTEERGEILSELWRGLIMKKRGYDFHGKNAIFAMFCKKKHQ
ncbi:MAG: hypothetical protein LBJ39_05820 [Tannerellaceae bacterium]|jgi:hypothetical protein|nr:hypothetical protein [Tannerellaceae bacterium]